MISELELFEGANVRYKADFDRGIANGPDQITDVRPWMDDVDVVEESASYVDPRSGETVVMFHEFNPYLAADNGAPQYEQVLARTATISHNDFRKDYQIKLRELRQPAVQAMWSATIARTASFIPRSKRKDFFAKLVAGDANLCYDGQNFFDTDHPGATSSGSSLSQANVFDLAFSSTNLTTVVNAMMGYRNTQGAHLGNKWMTYQMASQMESREMRPALPVSFHIYCANNIAVSVADVANLATSSPSAFAGTFTFDSIDELPDDYWIVRFLTPGTKPLLYVNGGDAFIAKAQIDDETMRMFNRAEFTLKSTWGFGYRDWACMAMSRGAE